jgi:hypothetical protein
LLAIAVSFNIKLLTLISIHIWHHDLQTHSQKGRVKGMQGNSSIICAKSEMYEHTHCCAAKRPVEQRFNRGLLKNVTSMQDNYHRLCVTWSGIPQHNEC